MKYLNTDQILQFTKGAVWDGDLISKTDTELLRKGGYVKSYKGFNALTHKGLKHFVDLGFWFCKNNLT